LPRHSRFLKLNATGDLMPISTIVGEIDGQRREGSQSGADLTGGHWCSGRRGPPDNERQRPRRTEGVRTLNYITTSTVYVLRNISRVLTVGAVATARYFCHVCWLFGDAQAQSSTWVSGIRDWQHLSQSIEAHVKSKQHRHCVGAYATYAEGKSVDSQMRKIVLEEERKWNHILTQQFGLLRLLTGLGLPVRGHRETVDSNNPGVYLSLLRFMSNSDPTLAQHLAGDSRIKYVSKTIMEEQIKLLAREVHSVLIAEC
jgi:hypothetical protein